MVGAYHLVPVRDACPFTEEQRPVIGKGSDSGAGLFGQYLDVFKGQIVRHHVRFLEAVYHYHLPVVAPGRRGQVARRHGGQELIDIRNYLAGDDLGRRYEDGG